jgi:hypothetical protein
MQKQLRIHEVFITSVQVKTDSVDCIWCALRIVGYEYKLFDRKKQNSASVLSASNSGFPLGKTRMKVTSWVVYYTYSTYSTIYFYISTIYILGRNFACKAVQNSYSLLIGRGAERTNPYAYYQVKLIVSPLFYVGRIDAILSRKIIMCFAICLFRLLLKKRR